MDETLRAFVAAQVADRLLQFRLQRQILVPNPAAGADWTLTVPGGVYWELLAVRTQILTSAAVANRFALLDFRDPDNNRVLSLPPGAVATAGGAFLLNWAIGTGVTINQGSISAPLPSPAVALSPGFILRSSTTGIDVGDQYSATVVTVREWSAGQTAQHFEKVLADTFALRIADREI